MYRQEKVQFKKDVSPGHLPFRHYYHHQQQQPIITSTRGQRPNRSEKTPWNFGGKLWIYLGIITVYLTLIAIVIVLILVLLPGHKNQSESIREFNDRTTVTPTNGLKPKLWTGIDPRRRNDLPVNAILRIAEAKDRSEYNSKILDVDEVQV